MRPSSPMLTVLRAADDNPNLINRWPHDASTMVPKAAHCQRLPRCVVVAVEPNGAAKLLLIALLLLPCSAHCGQLFARRWSAGARLPAVLWRRSQAGPPPCAHRECVAERPHIPDR